MVITKKDITELETRAVAISKKAIIKITSQEKLSQANEIMAKLKIAKKFIAEKKESILGPLRLATKNSRELFRPIEEKIATSQSNLETGILSYKRKVDEAKRLQQEKIEKEAKAGKIDFDKASEKMEKVEAKTDAFKMRKLKEVEITDESKIPQEYWEINMVRLRKHVLAGKKVKGTKIVIREIAL